MSTTGGLLVRGEGEVAGGLGRGGDGGFEKRLNGSECILGIPGAGGALVKGLDRISTIEFFECATAEEIGADTEAEAEAEAGFE